MITSIYLIRTLSVEEYAVLAFLIGISAFFSLIFDFGFHLSFVRKVAIAGSSHGLSEIIYISIIIKIILAIAFALPYVILSSQIEIMSEKFELALLFYLVSVGHGILPLWAYQGLQKLRGATILVAFLRATNVILVLSFVQDDGDLLLYPLIIGVSTIFISILMYINIILNNNLSFSWVYLRNIKKHFIDASTVFWGSISTSGYTLLITVFLGIFTTKNEVAIYAACEKIIHAIRGATLPIIQATYPRISEFLSKDGTKGARDCLKVIKIYYIPLLILLSFFSIVTGTFAEFILSALYGSEYAQAATLLRIMLFLPVIILIGNISGVQILLSLGLNKLFRNIIVIAALAMLTSLLILNNGMSAVRVSLLLIVTEVFITGSFLIFASLRILNILNNKR